jgi:hypothetical protein
VLRRASFSCLAIVAIFAITSRAHAQRPDLSHGRGLVWGASVTAPIITTTVGYAGGVTLAPVVPPGGGIEGRLGIELDSGFTLEFAGGIDGHAVDAQAALVRYRASAQVRMPFDLGGDVFPYVGAGVALSIFSRNQSIATTFDVRGLVGLSWWLEPWFALDFHVAVDVTPPGFAFTDTIVIVTPALGVALAY